MRPGHEDEKVFCLGIVTLKEGEMWGTHINTIHKWVDSDGVLKMKFNIYQLYF